MTETEKTAGIVIIGDEILSGRTKDTNFNTIALYCEAAGLRVREGRTVGDVQAAIVEAVNALRTRYDYVFTTGGIGPTHDDITADAIGAAFGVPIEFNPQAIALLSRHYGAERFNDARRRMARAPVGATLIDNPVSIAPGFMIGNVVVMAGVPAIMKAMLESVRPRLVGGAPMLSEAFAVTAPEGDIATPLAEIASRYPDVAIGSYPSFRDGGPFVRLVVRSVDEAALAAAAREVGALAERFSG